jgi:hypothetical protein
MVQVHLSDSEEKLIRKVCELQLNSFQKILSSPKEKPVQEKLKEYHLSEKELNSMISGVAAQYRDIHLTPASLFHTHFDLLGNFSEALDFNAESLDRFSGILPSLRRKLESAIYCLQNSN